MKADWQVFMIPDINPEPWTVGTLSIGRRGGKIFPMVSKDQQLVVFQEAVKEWFGLYGGNELRRDWTGPVCLEFAFWRQQIAYENKAGRQVRKHQADLTNLQKALEDALQGVLYKNDNQVVRVKSTMVEQDFDAAPNIIVKVMYLDEGMSDDENVARLGAAFA